MLRLQNEFTINKLRFSSIGLYGRDEEQKVLLDTLGRVIANNTAYKKHQQMVEAGGDDDAKKSPSSFTRELIWVKGLSGCGKSRLVESVLSDGARRHKAIYVRGKFDLNNQLL